MADLNWDGNTKEIYDKVLAMTPAPFRKLSEKNLTEAIVRRVGDGGTVTEDIIVASIKEVTPKPFLAMGMKQIEHLLKNS